jgi:heat shock protein HtpX
MRRRELFPPDRGLQVRMALVAVLTPLAVLVAVAGLVLVADWRIVLALAGLTAIGAVSAVRARRARDDARTVSPDEAPELHATVERLCVVADLPKPELVLDPNRQPNSWVIDLPARAPRLHVTQGLLDLLTPEELEAVLAHELSHIVHRDATVISAVGLPGAILLEGGRDMNMGWWPLMVASLFACVTGALSQAGVNALSRYREMHADAAAARLSGRPAALASALMKVTGAAATIPKDDLRAVAAHNAFNLLPVEIRPGKDDGWSERVARRLTPQRLGATHPTVERRVAALEQLERQMHGARPSRRLLDD